jgi:DNA-binding IclR family transcriptional regulator
MAAPQPSADEEAPKPRVQSVSRAGSILIAVAASPRGLTAKELSERLRLNLPTTYHLLRTLSDDAFLARGPDRRYRLGLRVGTLAEGFARHLAPDPRLVAAVDDLAELTGEMAYLTVRRGQDVVLLTAVASRHAVRTAMPSLGRLPDSHARATGKVALAYAPPEVLAAFLRAPLTRCTENTITDPPALERELEEVRRRGYATNMEELSLGACAMATPLDDGASPFALALSAPRDRFDANFDEYLGALRRTAAAFSSAALVDD